MTCADCDETLDGDEIESHNNNDEGAPVCDDCWYDKYVFTCCRCENYEEKRHKGAMFAVFDPSVFDRSGHRRGLYRELKRPFYSGPLIGRSSLFASAVEFVAEIPDDGFDESWPCGRLCRECIAALAPPAQEGSR